MDWLGIFILMISPLRTLSFKRQKVQSQAVIWQYLNPSLLNSSSVLFLLDQGSYLEEGKGLKVFYVTLAGMEWWPLRWA